MKRPLSGLLAVLAGALIASSARADDLSTLRTRVVDALTGGFAPTSDTGVAAAQKSLVSQATTLLTLLQPNGSFSDLSYADQPTGTWSVGTHFGRVLTLAQAYSVPGTLQHDAPLKTSITAALTYGGALYCGSAACVVGNWWYWEIGVPNALGPTLILMQADLDAALFAKLLAALKFHVGDVAHMQTFTGENLLWCAMNHLRISLLEGDASQMTAVKAAVETTCAINSVPLGDGIKPDHSFVQHGGQLYTGGYGAGYAADIATYLQLTDTTAFAPSRESKTNAIDYVADGVAWTVFDRYFDPEVVGREITRANKTASSARNALVNLSFVTSPRQAEIRGEAKKTIAALGNGGIDIVALSEQVAALPDASAMPSGHRHFYSTDHTVHRRDGYYASIKMLSKRTKSGELVNNEGKLGSRQSDGRLSLVRSGGEYFKGNLWPALDWSRLPGITVEQNGHAANQDYGAGTTAFVGGTGDETNGVSAMDAAPLKTTLRAKKSWFFFDDFIVFLGSDITDTGPSPVETIVEQWPLSAPDQPLVADGKTIASGLYAGVLAKTTWVASDGLGYQFPGGADVKAEIKDQSGDWSSLGIGSGTVSARFLTLSLSHGAAPTAASYAYAIALAGQDMATWTAAPPFTVLSNDAAIAAVRAGKSTGIVFFAPGTIDVSTSTKLTTDTACVVFVSDDGNVVSLAAADPAQGAGTMGLTLKGAFADASSGDAGATVDKATGRITIDRTQGVTHTVRLARTGSLPALPEAGAGKDDAATSTDQDGAADDGSSVTPLPDEASPSPSVEPTPAESRGGCGCSAARDANSHWLALALLGLAISRPTSPRHRARDLARSRRSGSGPSCQLLWLSDRAAAQDITSKS
jgi:MYXO-CTERM domain-containing protein